jgi:hypothetical protein
VCVHSNAQQQGLTRLQQDAADRPERETDKGEIQEKQARAGSVCNLSFYKLTSEDFDNV